MEFIFLMSSSSLDDVEEEIFVFLGNVGFIVTDTYKFKDT